MSSKLLSLVAFVTLFSINAANADDWSSSNSQSEYACCENQCEYPCCEIPCKPKRNIAISGDFLYWRSLQNGLDDCFCEQKIKDRWAPGYRVGLELSPECEGWDIAAYWVQYQNKSHRGQSDDIDGFSHWRLNYDTIDLLFGYRVIGSNFNYIPYIGLRGAKIDEKLNALFTECTCDGVTSDSITHLHHTERFEGIGPKIGVKGDYTFGCSNFGIYADIALGLLYGRFNIHARDFEEIPNPTDNGAVCNKRHITACQAVVDAAVGLQWKRSFCSDKFAIFVKVGLEHHRYFNQTRLGSYGDLCFDGATATLGLQF